MKTKIVLLIICISLLPFISSFGTLIDPDSVLTETQVETYINNSNFNFGNYNVTADWGIFNHLNVTDIFTNFTIGSVLFIGTNGNVTEFNNALFFEPNGTTGKLAVGDNSGMRNIFQAVKDESIKIYDNVKSLMAVRNINTDNGTFAGLSFQTVDIDGDIYSGARIMANFTNHNDDSVSGDLIFDTRHEGTRTIKMILNSLGNLEVYNNITADNWCNSTNCYTLANFLTGGANVFDQWLNTTSDVNFDNLSLSGDISVSGGAIFKGAILGDSTMGYDNIRYGVYAGTPRIILDNGTRIGQIDFISNSLRFIINDTTSGHTRTRLRINSTSVNVGEIADNVDLQVWGDMRIVSGNSYFGDTSNYTEIKNDGEINLYGTARVERHLRVGAGSFSHGASAPTEGHDGPFVYLAFDSASDDEVHYTVIIPHRWDSSTDVEFAVDWYYTGTQDNGNVNWALDYKSIKEGEIVTGGATTINQTSAGTHTTGQMIRTTFTTKILSANLEAHDTFALRLYRDISEDTLAIDAKLLNTHFHFTENKLGKSL